MKRVALPALALLGLLSPSGAGWGCSKRKAAGGASATAAAEVGRVSAVSGDVRARRGGATRVLQVGDAVFGDDVLITGVAASVAVKLVSGAVYQLGAEKTRPLAEVVVQLGGLGAGAGGEGDVTAAAGRHAEESAADTSATAPTEPTETETDDEAGGSGTRMQGEEGQMGKASTGKGAPGGGAGAGAGSAVEVDGFGEGGLGMSGTGAGGGGRGEGIGLGGIGTIGHGSGTGSGQGFGSGTGRLGGGTAAKAAKVELRKPTVKGGLPAEVVQRILRQNLGRWRMCYENALKVAPASKPTKVVLQFVIDPEGAVLSPLAKAASLSAEALACLRGGLGGLQFPSPSGGKPATVEAELTLTPP